MEGVEKGKATPRWCSSIHERKREFFGKGVTPPTPRRAKSKTKQDSNDARAAPKGVVGISTDSNYSICDIGFGNGFVGASLRKKTLPKYSGEDLRKLKSMHPAKDIAGTQYKLRTDEEEDEKFDYGLPKEEAPCIRPRTAMTRKDMDCSMLDQESRRMDKDKSTAADLYRDPLGVPRAQSAFGRSRRDQVCSRQTESIRKDIRRRRNVSHSRFLVREMRHSAEQRAAASIRKEVEEREKVKLEVPKGTLVFRKDWLNKLAKSRVGPAEAYILRNPAVAEMKSAWWEEKREVQEEKYLRFLSEKRYH